MTEYRGVLLFHSETGTEGGYWAMQDEAFIFPPEGDPVNKHCTVCHRWWADVAENPEEPPPNFTYYRDDWVGDDGTRYGGGYFGSDHPIDGGQTWFRGEEPGSFNDRWTKQGNAAALECYVNGHQWDWVQPQESWSYEGLHVLSDGDQLEVYHPDDGRTVWNGTIKLDHHDLFTEDASGMWIHADQAGEDRETWARMFFEGWPCRMVTSD